eukprot:TRINITY_DN6384_c0_g1_i16.p1 TRINITY_DN6384_c0_g1~~TRINITY_DN6384_c0_g1_i16.p1  ORF type:complete len:100 (-),score=5.10 TRINITY_DN6384_c0_g1_i16:130-429(-)
MCIRDRHHGLCDPSDQKALEIALSRPSHRIQRMLLAASGRWNTNTHWAWPTLFRRSVVVVMMTELRLATEGDLPVLHDHLWQEVISWLPWTWKLVFNET